VPKSFRSDTGRGTGILDLLKAGSSVVGEVRVRAL
jgi:hypothetical protein